MARPQNRQQLAEYCLRALGAPVIEINIDDDQVEDRIDEALQYYQEYHSDAVVRTYFKYQLTATDFTNKYITLPDALLFVTRVMNIGKSNASTGMFSVEYQMHLNDLYSLRQPNSLIDYEITKQYMSLIDMTINGMSQQITFSRHQNRLSIEMDWDSKMREGQFIIVEGYIVIDPDEYPDIYNDKMLKKHLTALLKRQWGLNLIKFEGMQLPGGVTLNGRQIYDDAVADLEKIETEYQDRYSMPPDFFTG
jgi:hypothetical protein